METIYLKSSEAADYLGLSESYLAKLRMGTTPVSGPKYVKIGPRAVRYRKMDLDDWMEQRTVGCQLSGAD